MPNSLSSNFVFITLILFFWQVVFYFELSVAASVLFVFVSPACLRLVKDVSFREVDSTLIFAILLYFVGGL